MDPTLKLELERMAENQEQAEVIFNNVINLLDAFVQSSVIQLGLNDPPGAPDEGDAYIIGDTPTGEWVGHGGEWTAFIGGGWVYREPLPGWRFWVDATDKFMLWNGTTWCEIQMICPS